MLRVEGLDLPLRVQRHARAQRISLRLDHRGEALHLVVPRYTSLKEALAFAESQADWVARRLDETPARVPFEHGARIPLLGTEHVILHHDGTQRGVWLEPGRICVSGRPEHLGRRVTDFLKRQSRAAIVERAQAKAKRLERPVRRITLRDTRSRWGSCSPQGDLNFSWRLVLAPEYVLDYVVAHEVAHLAELNHGPRFWRLTASLTDRMGAAKRWLRQHGHGLHRYG